LKSIISSGQLPDGLTLNDLLQINLDTINIEKIYEESTNKVVLFEHAGNSYVLKKFGWRNPIHFLLSPTFNSRAQASWNTAQGLISANALTPEPIYVYTVRKFGWIYENIFLTTAIHPHVKFRELNLDNHAKTHILKATRSLAQSIANMHNAGIIHNDLTNGNFLVDEAGLVYIVDLNRAHFVKNVSIRKRLRDLAKINFRFIRDYEEKIRSTFFASYAKHNSFNHDWEKGYIEFRTKRLIKRRMKKGFRKIFTNRGSK
jgi:hypothetical protein